MNILSRLSLAAIALLSATAAYAEVSVTTGGGYMNMVKELSAAFSKESGQKVTENYGGNIGQMMSQVAAGNGANVVISDAGTLKQIKTPVQFSETKTLGTTPLVLVWRKGLNLTGAEGLAGDQVKSFAYPDPKAAVYGRAAKAYLEGRADLKGLSGKELKISTVPQVMAYVSKGEVDAGFVNLTAARAGKDKVGGVQIINNGYPAIVMVANVVKGSENDKEVQAFLKFLASDKAKAILSKHGIE